MYIAGTYVPACVLRFATHIYIATLRYASLLRNKYLAGIYFTHAKACVMKQGYLSPCVMYIAGTYVPAYYIYIRYATVYIFICYATLRIWLYTLRYATHIYIYVLRYATHVLRYATHIMVIYTLRCATLLYIFISQVHTYLLRRIYPTR